MAKSLCTDTDFWNGLDDDEEKERHLRAWSINYSYGRMCKKAMIQVYYQARNSSSVESACRHVLFAEITDLKKKERKAFVRAYELAKSWFDQQVHDKLLNVHGFHQNAKVIAELKRMVGEAAGSGLPEYHEVISTNPEKDYDLDGTN